MVTFAWIIVRVSCYHGSKWQPYMYYRAQQIRVPTADLAVLVEVFRSRPTSQSGYPNFRMFLLRQKRWLKKTPPDYSALRTYTVYNAEIGRVSLVLMENRFRSATMPWLGQPSFYTWTKIVPAEAQMAPSAPCGSINLSPGAIASSERQRPVRPGVFYHPLYLPFRNGGSFAVLLFEYFT